MVTGLAVDHGPSDVQLIWYAERPGQVWDW